MAKGSMAGAARPVSSPGQARLVLKPGREKSLLRRHPWVFSGALAHIENEPAQGEMLMLRSAEGAFLGWAAWNARSQIVARVWSWHEDEIVGNDLLRRRLQQAISAREPFVARQAVRLVHGESDGFPGLVVDRYADVLVMQALSAGAQRLKETLADLLCELTGARDIYERSDAEVLELEGLSQHVGALRGAEPDAPLKFSEGGLMFEADVRAGHKTGFYLDQRDNRALLAAHVAGREVLDCFCYSGGFTVSALRGGAAAVTAVDSSAPALASAREQVRVNRLPEERVSWIEGDVFQVLRKLRDQARRFDVIVLDPPKFAPTAALAERAARGYKDINLLAFKLLRAGGHLFTFSCSGGVSRDLFQKIVAGAALDARVQAQIQGHMSAAADHPVALNFPEGEYLKGLLCRVA